MVTTTRHLGLSRSALRTTSWAIAAALSWPSAAFASLLEHIYEFDAGRLRIEAGPVGASLGAEGLPRTWEAGRPEIPYDIVTLLVPRGARVAGLRVEPGRERVVARAELAEAQAWADDAGRLARPRAPRLAAAARYPALDAELAGGGALHGYQLVSVRVYPVQYDAGTASVVVRERLRLAIELEPGGARPLERQRWSPLVEARARRTLAEIAANAGALDAYDRRIGVWVDPPRGFQPTQAPSLEGSPVDYVIVTRAALAPAWQVLADWKTRRGVPTVVRTVEWIEANYRRGCDLQETIRTFVRDAYVKWGVQFVLLGGDTDGLPARYGFSAFGAETERDIPTDMYFACLDGSWNRDGDALWGEAAINVSNPGDSTDLYAEVFVGRAPVSTPAEAASFVQKIVTYEDPPDSAYQRKVLLLGEVLLPVDWVPGQTITLDGASFSEEMAALVPACPLVHRLYENHTPFPGSGLLRKQTVIDSLNQGYGLVNHIGHGYRYNMSLGDASLVNSDAYRLTNGNRRFILYFLNCTATAFDFPCLAEAFLKAPGGAVAVLGSSRAAFALPSRNYNREFFKALYVKGYKHLGEVFVQSRLAYTPNAWFDTSDHYTHLLYNLLGDPEMVAHTCSLATTVVAHADTIGLGATNIVVQVTAGGAPRAGARVCLQKGLEAYGFGVTDSTGSVALGFVAESPGTVAVTVSGQNMRTHHGSIAVVAGASAYVHVQNLTLDDGGTAPSAGNGDGALDAGETLAVGLVLVNDGAAAAAGVGGVLRVPSPWATVTDSSFAAGGLAAGGGTAAAAGTLAFAVDAATPDGTVLPLHIVSTDGFSTWTDVVNRVVRAPAVRLVRLAIDDAPPGGNGDGVIQAGETFDLAPCFKNYGTGAADGVVATLATSDPDIALVADTILVGRLDPLAETVGATAFRLTESVLDENLLALAVTDSHGRSNAWSITLRGPAPPAAPVLDASTGADVVLASWTLGSEPDLAGYHVYRALAAAGPWTRITADRTARIAYYRDTGLAASTRYHYRVTALDTSGNESAPSPAANVNTNPAQVPGWPIQLGAASSCPAAVGDITGDGQLEVVAGNDHLYAWRHDGIELRDDDNDPQTWGVFAAEVKTITGAVALAEMDPASPGLETFVTVWDDTNKAYAVRGDGSFLPGWPRNPNPTSSPRGYWAAGAAVDVDQDGRAEVFAYAKNGNLYAWRWDGTPLGASAVFKSGLGTYSRCSPAFANLDADPELEIVLGAPNGTLQVWNVDGSNFGGFPVAPGTLCYSNTAIGDVNRDGILDIVMLTEGGAVNVYNSQTATQLPGWPRTLSIKGNPVSPSPALADFDFDGYLEIVVAHVANPLSLSGVRVYDYQGNLRPGWPKTTGGKSSESSPIVADVSGDGVPDIVFGNEGGLLYGWDAGGNEIPGFPLAVGDFIRSTPFATDVDGDGDIDMVLAGWDKNIYVWDFPAPWVPAAAQWPTLKHDMHRSSQYGFVFDSTPPSHPTVLASMTHAPGNWSNAAVVQVAWSGAGDPSGIGGYSYVWDTAPATIPDTTVESASTSATSPALADGQDHWFHLRTVDALGNWTAGALHLGPFWIDTTPPANPASIAADRAPSTWSNDATIDAAWAAASDGPGAGKAAPPAGAAASGIAGYSLVWDTEAATVPDAAIETAGLAATSPALADGQAHWLHLRAVDLAGNAAAEASHLGPFWVDATPPSAPTAFAGTPAAGAWARAESLAVTWSGDADALAGVAGYSILFDGASATEPDSTLDTAAAIGVLAPAAEGATWLHVRVLDAAGNASPAAHAGPFLIDNVPPANPASLTADRDTSAWSNDATIDVQWTPGDDGAPAALAVLRSAGSGIAGYSIAWDTEPATEPDTTIDTAALAATSPALADGQAHWFHLRAVDMAGNAAPGALHIGPFWVDATPPQDPAVVTANLSLEAWTQAETLAVSWSGASDALAGVAGYSILFDSEPATVPDAVADTHGESVAIAPPPDGVTWFHLRTSDAAGNWTGSVHLGPFRIDNTPPAVLVLAPNGGEVWAPPAVETIRWQAEDAGSGIAAVAVRYSTDGGATYPIVIANPAPGDSSVAWTIPLAPGDSTRVQVLVTDVAGNSAGDASDGLFTLALPTDSRVGPPVARYELEPNAPNPFNPRTRIRFALLATTHVDLGIYDARGRRVRTLARGRREGPRWHTLIWDGTDDAGRALPSGVYLLRIATPEWRATRRLVLLK